MGLSEADLAFCADSERRSFDGAIVESLSVYVEGAGSVDPYTDEFVPAAPAWVALQGTLSVLTEEDILVGIEGGVKAGDYVAKFYGPDAIDYIETPKIRRDSDGQVFTVATRLRTGIGPAPHRIEFGLKAKPNEG